jgi:hypothetical protein
MNACPARTLALFAYWLLVSLALARTRRGTSSTTAAPVSPAR